MDRLAIIQGQKIVETTDWIFQLKKRLKLWIDWLKSKAKKLLKQRFDFPVKEEIETMDRLAIIQGQKIVEATVGIFQEKKRLKLLIDWL